MSIHLQGIGPTKSKPASAVRAGDTLVWNYGATSTVAAVRDVSRCFIEIDEVTASGYTGTRRLKKTRQVGVA